MSTPERQQDPGDHGYGGTQQEKHEDDRDEHPLEDPDADPRQESDREDADEGMRARPAVEPETGSPARSA